MGSRKAGLTTERSRQDQLCSCCVPDYLFYLIEHDWKGRTRQFPKSEDSD